MYSHDVLVIGGGAAGLTATAGLAQLGLKTAVFDREKLGGDCLYFGCVPSKTLIKSATVYQQYKKAEAWGLPAANLERPDLSKVNARVQSVIQSISHHDSPERFEGLGAEVYFGSPKFTSPHEIELDGKKYSAKNIIIASGSRAMVPPIPGLKETGFITNREVFSLQKLPESMITIGGGPIGAEMSQSFQRFGCKVTIIDMAPHILPREDQDMAEIIQKRFDSEGVTQIYGAKIIRLEKSNGKKRVYFEKDGKEQFIEAEEVLLSVGRTGNVEDLALENAGIEGVKRFIPVNAALQTQQKHIMAIGDVNGKFQFTHVAGAEGSVAVRRIAFKLPAKMDYTFVPWATYTDPELASVGLNEKRAKEAGISYQTLEAPFEDVDRAQAEGHTDGKIKMLMDKKERLIGVQIAGPHAGDLIAPHLYAVRNNEKLMNLYSPMFPYPVLGEIQKKASGGYLGKKIFNPKIRGILKRIFGYRG
jgi:pyruvate/2-oxoglutarate dehydrogenase complex dihydrolipoamide dehydrogenase (E3) component